MFSKVVLINWNIVLPLYFSILAILFKEKVAVQQKVFIQNLAESSEENPAGWKNQL